MQPYPDGTDCDPDASDCTAHTCSSGTCGTAPAADCSACGATGSGLCGGGVCTGPDEVTSYGFESGIAPFASSSPAWRTDGTRVHGGALALRSGVIGDGGSTSVTVTVTGPGTYGFWYKVSSEAGYDYLRFSIDGTNLDNWAGNVGWTHYTATIGAGAHTLMWTYDKDGSTANGDDAAFIDDVTFPAFNTCGADECGSSVLSGGTCVSCGEVAADCTPCAGGADVCAGGKCGGRDEAGAAIDFESTTWPADVVFTSPVHWVLDATTSASGTRSARSGSMADGETSTIQRTVDTTHDGTVSFSYRTSSESGYDFIVFAIDGVEQLRNSGEVGWTAVSYPLSAGHHALSWSYTKDGSTALGSDAVWIDNVIAGDVAGCTDDACGLQRYDGGACVTCPLQPDGATCDSDTTDCTGATCGGGRCVEAGFDDCTACGATGTGACMGGVCGGDTLMQKYSFESGTFAPFTTRGSTWYVGAGRGHDGNFDALASMSDNDDAYLTLNITITEAGTVSFWHKWDLSNPDDIHFTIDGVGVGNWSGSGNWRQQSYPLTAGAHTLEWHYSSGWVFIALANREWDVDDIRFEAVCPASDTCSNWGFDGTACMACDTGACTP